jgi:hypothetical protein
MMLKELDFGQSKGGIAMHETCSAPPPTGRAASQVGAIGLLGLGMPTLSAFKPAIKVERNSSPPRQSRWRAPLFMQYNSVRQ